MIQMTKSLSFCTTNSEQQKNRVSFTGYPEIFREVGTGGRGARSGCIRWIIAANERTTSTMKTSGRIRTYPSCILMYQHFYGSSFVIILTYICIVYLNHDFVKLCDLAIFLSIGFCFHGYFFNTRTGFLRHGLFFSSSLKFNLVNRNKLIIIIDGFINHR